MCLRVGELLLEARAIDPDGFRAWVESKMPFGIDKARRLIAIHLAYRDLPPETIAQLPEPWQALYALRHWVGGKLDEALAANEIGPGTTVEEAQRKARHWSNNTPKGDGLDARYTMADTRAGALMDCDPAHLNPLVRDALLRWLGHPTPGIDPGNLRR